jgi:hypothetical protein
VVTAAAGMEAAGGVDFIVCPTKVNLVRAAPGPLISTSDARRGRDVGPQLCCERGIAIQL